MPRPDRESYLLTLIDCGTPSDGPAIQRLRAFLKRALRAYALRCTSVVEARPNGDDRTPDEPPRGEPAESH